MDTPRPCIIYACVVGSHAYGLDHEGSDTDRCGVYLPPADLHWSLFGAPDHLEDKEGQEYYWRSQQFLVIALRANPNILECLHTPLVEHAEPLAHELLATKRGKLAWEETNRLRLDLHARFDAAFARASLPERPDYVAANDFLLRAALRLLVRWLLAPALLPGGLL